MQLFGVQMYSKEWLLSVCLATTAIFRISKDWGGRLAQVRNGAAQI